jgi:hypothetical protein
MGWIPMNTGDDGENRPRLSKYPGLKITVSEGRWRPVIRAIESQERALSGDNQLLNERLQAGRASHDEQRLAGDLSHEAAPPSSKGRSHR